MRLRNGTQHEAVNSGGKGRYQVSTFAESELPLVMGTQEDLHIGHSNTPILAMSNSELYAHTKGPNGRSYLIQMHRRFAYPAACLVLMLIGIPLGMSSRRGGKSAGFVLTIALVFIYYYLSSTGEALANQGKVPIFVPVWTANILFAVFGILLLRQIAVGGNFAIGAASLVNRIKNARLALKRNKLTTIPRTERHARGRFPLILDDYVSTGVPHDFRSGARQLCHPDPDLQLL